MKNQRERGAETRRLKLILDALSEDAIYKMSASDLAKCVAMLIEAKERIV